ncbi:MAG: BA14K family protein [Propylenella sp.]
MRILSSLSAAALIVSAVSTSTPARADGGDALLGGVIGFAAGTLFGQAAARPRYYYYEPVPVYVAPPPAVVYSYAPEPWTPEWYAYCGKRFVSFDARSGTYLGHDGYRHMCH